MALSQLSGIRMRNLLFGVILGLLAVVHSTPVATVTQIPTKAEDEVFREAVTEGFLVDHSPHPLLTTEPPTQKTTVKATQQPSSDSTNNDVIEDSGFATSVFPEYAHSPDSTASPTGTEDSTSDSSTIGVPQSTFNSLSVPNEAKPSSSSSSTAAFTKPKVPVMFSRSEASEEGSSEGSGEEMFITVSTTTEEATMKRASGGLSSTASPKAPVTFAGSEGLGLESDDGSGMITTVSTVAEETTMKTSSGGLSPTTSPQTTVIVQRGRMGPVLAKEAESAEVLSGHVPVNPPTPQKGHSTPGWAIIVAFIVGVGALVMICVAIATRDKWNGPRQASKTKTNSTDQQREQEMETFVHQDQPRENGKAAEYTVIPLDELPENYSSH